MTFTRIAVRADQIDGVPCIRRLRLPVAAVVGMIAESMTAGEVFDATRTSSSPTCRKHSTTRPKPSVSASCRSPGEVTD